MSRTKWIEEMINSGKKEDEIIAAILAGNAMVGIKPMAGEGAAMFAKLNYKKTLKKLQAKK